MYRFNSFTTKTNQVINFAIKIAGEMGHNFVGTEHLMLGLIKEKTNEYLFNNFNIDFQKFFLIVSKNVGVGMRTKLSPLDLTVRAKKVMELSYQVAKSKGHSFVCSEHLLISILKESSCSAVSYLEECEVSCEMLLKELINNVETNDNNFDVYQKQNKKVKSKTPVLDEYGTNLNDLAKQGKIDLVIGREKEINRLIQVLCRRTKSNPCLIGEPGVGKTAIAEGLALKIINCQVPDALLKAKIYTLDLTLMVAGTKYRGDFEERIKKVMDEVKNDKNIILFIDELHNIMGAGAAEGAIDAANILKPSLARGELQLIGATTIKEYHQYIEKDAALERRFQPIIIEEPSLDETVNILKKAVKNYENYHQVKISEEIIYLVVSLSKRYINDRFLPDKAIDLLDEAASKVKIDSSRTNKEVLEEDVLIVLSQWTKIPVTNLSNDETAKLLCMEELLKCRLVGQNKALESVTNAVRRNRVGVSNPKRPVASFLFVGPTGVGKTELCKAIADVIFGGDDNIIKFDMSEYMEKHSVSKLIGSPPGYVGFEEGGLLTEKVRRNPYSLVLFDEIEKAHKDVYNLLLQIMEEGILTDSQGVKVSFKNTLIIMTSNVGANKIINNSKSLGFSASNDNSEQKELFMNELNNKFNPEFLNRIDEIITFEKLSKHDVSKIAAMQLSQLSKRMNKIGKSFSFSNEALNYLVEIGYSEKFGARPIRRIIQNYIENKFARLILEGEYKSSCYIDVNDNELAFICDKD